MKSILLGTGAAWASAAGFSNAAALEPTSTEGRLRAKLTSDWKFTLDDVSGAEQSDLDDSGWRSVNLPHDWSIEGPFQPDNPSGSIGGFAPAGIGWYRRKFRAGDFEAGKTLLIEFDGVYKNSQVWINGRYLGGRPSGYSGFQFNLGPRLLWGEDNLIAVRVDNSQFNSRWYSGSGIYRHVWLTWADELRVAHWGTYVRTPEVTRESAHMSLVTTVMNGGGASRLGTLETVLIGPDGAEVARTFTTKPVLALANTNITHEFDFSNPQLWSIDNPQLYTALSYVYSGSTLVDTYSTTFGIREVRFDPDSGLLLNGQTIKMKGVCLHHDAGCVGAAVPDRVIERRLEVLKSIGCNAIRTSHNPPAPALLDACDRLGLLVVDEAFDKWSGGLVPQYEQPEFDTWWQEDLRALLQRDRNHPSIVLWSVGNEAGMPGTDQHDRMLDKMVKFVHQNEPTRPVTCALLPQIDGTIEDIVSSILRSYSYMDVLALNYQEQWYPRVREANPEAVIIGAESYPFFRGIANGFDVENPWYDAAKNSYVAGQFVWSGFDYVGESAGWPSKGWPNGLINTCGFVKPRSFFFESVWKTEPLVRISVIDPDLDEDDGLVPWRWPKSVSHWTFPNAVGRPFAVEAPSNCETVELVVNGLSYGRQRSADFNNGTPVWYVAYEPGVLQAIGRNGDEVVATYSIRTAGAPASLYLQPDRLQVLADGQDVSHIEVQLLDANGVLVPNSDRAITFEVQGAGRLIGVDNGDLRSEESYKSNVRRTVGGRCLAIVQATRLQGSIGVSAVASDLPLATIWLNAD